MPYDRTKDPERGGANQLTQDDFGRKSRAVTPSDDTDLNPYVKGVVVTDITGGANLSIIPVENADGSPVSFVGVTVGFVPPFKVRRVRDTGTDFTVSTIE